MNEKNAKFLIKNEELNFSAFLLSDVLFGKNVLLYMKKIC